MFKFRNDTRFVEYPKAVAGQYSIKAEKKIIENKTEDRFNTKWITIGYLTKKFSKEENKYIYTATDSTGNQVFQNIKELHVLKQAFRDNGKQLAENAQMVRLARISKTNKSERTNNPQRNIDLKKLRDKKNDKQKTHEVLKQEQKAKNLKTEKELDAKNTEKYKDTEHSKTENPSKETSQHEVKPDIENLDEQDKVSERMEELEEIREQGNDIEQDIEMDR